MSDYIEREAAIAVIEEKQKELCPLGMYSRHAVYGLDREKFDAWQEIIDTLERIPAADVRPVVLCRDCVNYVESDEANGEKMCVIDADWSVEDGCYYGFTAYPPPDWFCAGGKKREES